MSRNKDKLAGLRGDAQPAPATPTETPAGRVWLVYAGTTGPEGHWQPDHEGPASWMIGDHFVGLRPGLNIRTAEQWAGADQNEAVAKLIADKKIIATGESLSGYDSVAARTALAKTSTDPAAVAWMFELEDNRPVTAGPRTRRQDKIVEILDRSLRRIRKKQPADFSGLVALAKERVSASPIAAAG